MGLHHLYNEAGFTLETERMIVRPYRASDQDSVADLMGDLRAADIPRSFLLRKAQQYIAGCGDDANVITLGLFQHGEILVGGISFYAHSKDAIDAWELNYHTISDFRRKGYMSEAVDALKPVFRDVVGTHELSATIHKFNRGSLGVMRSTQFCETGADDTHKYFKYVLN